MGKSKSDKANAKEDRKAKKAELNREREQGRRRRNVQLDSSEVASFAKVLLAEGLELKEVDRDGNCFFRSLCDQVEGHEHDHEKYRVRVMEHVEAHEDEFAPFMSFGESEEEEDKDFGAYIERMKTDGEWAGQIELIAAASCLGVHIVVHQFEHPSYRIECKPESKPSSSKASAKAKGSSKAVRDIHLSYHDGEHYNSVRVLLNGKEGGSGSTGNRFGGLRADGSGSAEAEAEETGDDRRSAVSGVADGVSGVQLDGDAAEDDEAAAPAEADGESGESAPEPLSRQDSKSDVKLKPKERRKEEKRLRKEQKHREAVAAAGGVDAAAEAGGGGAGEPGTPGGRSMIVL